MLLSTITAMFTKPAMTTNHSARRSGRSVQPAVDGLEPRLSLSGFTLTRVTAVSSFNPQPDPPTLRGIIAI